jgi:Icc-related predicted phosphoesterase
MRLLYSSDLHGNTSFYRELFALAADQQVAALIVGGDLLPRKLTLQDAISHQRAFIRDELRPLVERFRAARPQTDLYLVPGNDDWAAAIADLAALEADGLLYLLHGRVLPMVGADESSSIRWIAGYGCVPITPFSIKDYERRDGDDLPNYSLAMAYQSEVGSDTPLPISAAELSAQPSIADDLARLAAQSDPSQTLYVCHTPPLDLAIDLAHGERHIGSRSLRQFIEMHQPPLSLHGHIHEAPAKTGRYADQIGATWCLNPGNDARRLHAILFDSDAPAATFHHTIYGPLPNA